MDVEQETSLALGRVVYMAGPETVIDSDLGRTPRGRTTELPVGGRLGRFFIRGQLGRGGMGVVYLGYDAQLNRLAAIKLLRADRAGAGGNARMLREAQALAQISHPNVVQVHEVGEHGTDVYIAMEFVDGLTLREWLEKHPRDVSQICDRFIAAGRGLAAVHDKGLIHRDFKPDNIMIGTDERVRVMDFGLATAREEAHEHSDPPSLWATSLTYRTTTGACLGTPAYMAPEQHACAQLDARADQFGFCVSLWEALYGQRPFAGPTQATLMANIAAGRRSPPPKGSVSPRLRAVLDRGLSPSPEARWPSMHALLDALSDALHDGIPAPLVHVRSTSLDPNRVILAAVFGLISGAIGAHIAAFVGVVISTLATITMLYIAETLSKRNDQ